MTDALVIMNYLEKGLMESAIEYYETIALGKHGAGTIALKDIVANYSKTGPEFLLGIRSRKFANDMKDATYHPNSSGIEWMKKDLIFAEKIYNENEKYKKYDEKHNIGNEVYTEDTEAKIKIEKFAIRELEEYADDLVQINESASKEIGKEEVRQENTDEELINELKKLQEENAKKIEELKRLRDENNKLQEQQEIE